MCSPYEVGLAVSLFLTLSYPSECATMSLVWLIPLGEHLGDAGHRVKLSVISFMLGQSVDFIRWPWCHIVRKFFGIKKEYVGGIGYMSRVWDHALREERNITLPNLHWCIHRDLCKDFYTCYWASAGTEL